MICLLLNPQLCSIRKYSIYIYLLYCLLWLELYLQSLTWSLMTNLTSEWLVLPQTLEVHYMLWKQRKTQKVCILVFRMFGVIPDRAGYRWWTPDIYLPPDRTSHIPCFPCNNTRPHQTGPYTQPSNTSHLPITFPKPFWWQWDSLQEPPRVSKLQCEALVRCLHRSPCHQERWRHKDGDPCDKEEIHWTWALTTTPAAECWDPGNAPHHTSCDPAHSWTGHCSGHTGKHIPHPSKAAQW